MAQRRGILVTGATGLLGQYLLSDLLRKTNPVAVLARDSRHGRAAERVAQIVSSANERLGRALPKPVVLAGELGLPGLGLTAADRRWLARRCQAVIHSAANLSFRATGGGEPWRTNVEGTRSLLRLCRDLGVSEWHQVSTAFVCGQRTGSIGEEDCDHRPSFHNAYEESKYYAERLVRAMPGVRATVYRPSVIVGDSRTGHTSRFTGPYRLLELADRLASANPGLGKARLPLRLPLRGDEGWNLVPVDWVSRAVVTLLARPVWHGHNFHLVARSAVSARLVRDVASDVMGVSGVEFAGPEAVERPSRLAQLFLDGMRDYLPYFAGSPDFDSANTSAALPDLPPPPVDRPVLERLIRFAVASRWGRSPLQTAGRGAQAAPSSCGEYIERTFPKLARRSNLAREAVLDVTVGIDVCGPGGGQWTCQWSKGVLICVKCGLGHGAAVTYHTDAATFHAVVCGLTTPQEAFFERRIAITGDVETALKLAVLLGMFLTQHADSPLDRPEVTDASPLRPRVADRH
jgi:thioester reductase-like protein